MQKDKSLSKEEVLHLAKLANIELSENEITIYQKQLGEILNYVDQLKEVDVESLKETSYTVDTKNVNFEDGAICERLLMGLENLKIVKKDGKDYFVVNRIL